FQAEDGIRDLIVTGVQTCALPISGSRQRRHMASDTTDTTDGAADTQETRPCEICGRPIEAIRIEVIPATRLCQEHGQMIRKFGEIGRASCREREERREGGGR